MQASKLSLLIIAIVFLSGCVSQSVEERIHGQLVGTELEYYSFSGEKRVVVIQEENIQSVNETSDGWTVRINTIVGEWDVFFDKQGDKVRVEQLFRT